MKSSKTDSDKRSALCNAVVIDEKSGLPRGLRQSAGLPWREKRHSLPENADLDNQPVLDAGKYSYDLMHMLVEWFVLSLSVSTVLSPK